MLSSWSCLLTYMPQEPESATSAIRGVSARTSVLVIAVPAPEPLPEAILEAFDLALRLGA
jgi:hypothetical protein